MKPIQPYSLRKFAMLAVGLLLMLGMVIPAQAQEADASLEVIAVDPVQQFVTVHATGLPVNTEFAIVMTDAARLSQAQVSYWQVGTFRTGAEDLEVIHRIKIPVEVALAQEIQIRYIPLGGGAEIEAAATFNPDEELGESPDNAVVYNEVPSLFDASVIGTPSETTAQPTDTASAQLPATGASERSARRFASERQIESMDLVNRDYSQFNPRENGEPRVCGSEYVVANGEWLGLVVINCNVPLDDLLAANPQITNPDLVYTGEILRIPASEFGEIVHPITGSAYVTPAFVSGLVETEREQ